MANHSQLDVETKGDLSDRSQAISGLSSDLSSAVWQEMRSESGYLDAQTQRFTLYDSAASTNSAANATDAPLTIRTGVATDGASSPPYSLPKIEFFDSAATTNVKPQAGGIEASRAQSSSDAGKDPFKWETQPSTYVGNSNGAY